MTFPISSHRHKRVREKFASTHHHHLEKMTAYSSNEDSNGGNSTATLYATCSRLPLIKAPSLRVPPPVTLPPTLHPLPNNIHDYFVYPFSLEKFVLDSAEKREREKREELQRRAPGWIEGGGVLEPTKRTGDSNSKAKPIPDEVDELGAMLDQLGRA